jgi:hypothetical protein
MSKDLDKAVDNVIDKLESEELDEETEPNYETDHESITALGEYKRTDQDDQLNRNEINDPDGYKLRGLITDPRELDNPHTREIIKRNIRMTRQQWIEHLRATSHSREAKF